MNVKWIVTDMDGTLLNSRDEITERTKKALMACQEKGIRLILASGRSYIRQMPYAEELRLRQYGGCLIENNGLTINDMKPGGRHKLAYLGQKDIAFLFPILRKWQVEIQGYEDDGVYYWIPDWQRHWKSTGSYDMSETPKPRQIEIFRLLLTSGVPLDIGRLKEKLQKSERTIRYDIQDLKRVCQEYGIDIEYLTKKGYFIPAAQKPECSALLVQWDSGVKSGFVDGEEEKRFASLFFYLFVQKGYVTAEKLADVYLASKSTLTRGLGRLEEYFGNSFTLEIRKAQGYRYQPQYPAGQRKV